MDLPDFPGLTLVWTLDFAKTSFYRFSRSPKSLAHSLCGDRLVKSYWRQKAKAKELDRRRR